jgi:superfamily I DNA/RNA helicase/CRISPR/Cas system-associated exonuclease Cas4 (RecB family)
MHLDEHQRAVVSHGVGALLVRGGAGTGKTTVLKERFVALSRSQGCSPDRVLFLVGNRTHKMALQEELADRLLFDEGLEALIEVPVYTWHGFAYHLVTRHYDRLGYPEPPVLLTSPEQWGEIREALAGEPEVNWPAHKHLLSSPGFVDEVVDFCIRAEQRLLEEHELNRLVSVRPQYGEVVRFYRKQRSRLRDRARVDYPMLLQDAVSLIAEYEDVRNGLRERFLHVLVDDGQELSLVQQRLLRFLTGLADKDQTRARSLVVAADPNSAIETFRGADPGWLQRFSEEAGPHTTVELPVSYRLGPDAGARLMSFVDPGGDEPEDPERFAGRSTLQVRCFANLGAELEAIAAELRRLHLDERVSYEDMAVLLTSPASMLQPLERALCAVEVPYSVSVPDRPLEQESAVRTFRRLARFALGPGMADDELAELLRSSLGGLTESDVRELERDARTAGRSLAGAAMDPPPSTSAEGRARLAELLDLRALLAEHRDRPADEAFWVVWEASSHYRTLRTEARRSLAEPANRELDALVAFARSVGRFVERRRGQGTLAEYFEAVGRADFGADPWLPPQRAQGGVRILSFHAAKGRQWEVVAVAGCMEGAIPKGRRARGLFDPYFLDDLSAAERAAANEAEDRRVFYVATTRAARLCLVTASPGPTRRGQPSRFLGELVDELPAPEGAGDLPALTFSEAAAGYRRILADVSQPPPERIAALGAIAHICKLDPACTSATPAEWWWRWDWTEGAIPLLEQHPDSSGVSPGKLRTSYSRISKYDNCPLQYVLEVELGLDPDTSHAMAFGTWIHQIFEDIEKEPSEEQKKTGRRFLKSREDVKSRYQEVFDHSVFPNRAIARQYFADGIAMLDAYIDHLKPGTARKVEHVFRVDLDGHIVTGRIDRVDTLGKNVVVSDFKTSRSPVGWDEARESLQLAIYYLACKRDPELAPLGKPVSMQLVYPAKVQRNDVAKRCQKPDEAEKALERLPGLMEGVAREDFRPSPEADCFFCRFKPLCPLWPEGREVPA